MRVEQRVVRNNDIPSTNIGDELGLLDENSGKYFLMNDVGTSIWSEIQDPISVDELVDKLCGIYDIDKSHCSNDVIEYLEILEAKGLIKTMN